MDIDPYRQVICYVWKDQNDKLFREIDRDPLELVRYAESECQTWFNANETIPTSPEENPSEKTQVLSLGNIYMVDSWTSTA